MLAIASIARRMACLRMFLRYLFAHRHIKEDLASILDSPRKWRHLAFTVDAKDGRTGEAARQINQIGSDGWELVDVESLTNGGTTTKVVYCFKRPK